MRIGKTIYLDHQASTPVDSRVFAEMAPYFTHQFGNPHSSDHALGWESSSAVEDAARKIGELISADSDETIFTSGATEANNLALLGVGRRATNGKRRRILVSPIEHKCVLTACRVLEQYHGYQVQYLSVDQFGFVDLNVLEEAIAEDVLFVSISAVNNEIGTIQDVFAISEIARRYGALFHCDGAQAACAMDMQRFSDAVDLLSLSAHKIYGPKGIGVLFVRRDLQAQIEPLIYGGGQQNNLRSGTLPVPLCVGMGVAASLFGTNESEAERTRLSSLRDSFINKLMTLPWSISVNGPSGEARHPGNANICFKGFYAQEILAAIQPRLAASTGSACTSGTLEPSHVLRAIGLSANDAESSIRFSLGRGTTDDDINDAITVLHEALTKLDIR